MTSRERISRLLERQPVDRVPNGLGGCETAGLHNLAYHELKKVLGVRDDANRVGTFMNNAVFEPSVLDAIQGDVILLGSRMCPSRFWTPAAAEEWSDLLLWDAPLQVARAWEFRPDDDGAWWWGDKKCPPGAFYFDTPAGDGVAGDAARYEEPSPDDYQPSHELPEPLLRRLEEDAKWLHDNTDYAIACGEMIGDLQQKHGGLQSWWMRMVSDPDSCHAFLAKAVDAALSHMTQLHQAVGKYCAFAGIADDMGDTRGVTVGPDLWREIYKPHYARLFAGWHAITGMKVNLHTCGAVSDIIGDLVECGVDLLNPLQTSAHGMEPASLKERFGRDLVFYGGAYDAVQLPTDAPPEVVYDHVLSHIRAFSAGGGYLFAGVHNLPADIPGRHLEAMLAAYRDCSNDSSLTGAVGDEGASCANASHH